MACLNRLADYPGLLFDLAERTARCVRPRRRHVGGRSVPRCAGRQVPVRATAGRGWWPRPSLQSSYPRVLARSPEPAAIPVVDEEPAFDLCAEYAAFIRDREDLIVEVSVNLNRVLHRLLWPTSCSTPIRRSSSA